MTASQEILNSIDARLRLLAEEIAALRLARAELERKAAAPPEALPGPGGLSSSEEEWIRRRAAQLATQTRRAA